VSPEQIAGQTFDHRADIFSMGVVLWGALTGKRLFSGATVEDTLLQVCNKPIPPPSAEGAQSYPALDEVVLQALSRDPNARFESAEEMLTALGRVAAAHDGLATSKDIAAWVREAAGAELTQRRLAILDASHNADSVLADGDATTNVGPPQADDSELTHTVMTSELLSPAESHLPSRQAIPRESSVYVADIESEAAPDPIPAISPSPPTPIQSNASDVGSLFYGMEERVLWAPRSLSPASVRAVVSKSPLGSTRWSRGIRRGWLLATLVVLVLGLYLMFSGRRKMQSTGSRLSHSPVGVFARKNCSRV
jgi:serine/threonine-protein kinase